ncbi:MAG: diacylglycerol kinase family lipid kinase [Sphingobacteriales bacterium]|nr:MAG: diacylglycerol kinase family lipid kinase [Sphingobacteriales bacterium]
MLKILFVLNPISGGVPKAEIEAEIAEYTSKHNIHFEIYHTTGSFDKQSIQHWIKSIKPDRVVAVGGDGTLKLVAEVMLDGNLPLGIIPAGSANGMARELGLPTDITECLNAIVRGEADRVDVICINNRDICLHLSDIGMNAQLVKYFDESGLRGKLGYARGVLRMLLRRSLLQVRIHDGHKEIERNAFMVVLANARMYGTGAMINPEGDPRDGIFEVVVIRRLTLIALVKMFFRANKLTSKYIEIIPAQSVNIHVKKKAYFQVDGEYKGKVKAIHAEIKKHSLCLIKY